MGPYRLKFKPRTAQILGIDGKPLRIESRAYEASATGRRLGKWDAPNLGPNDAAVAELFLLQRRARAARRNIPWISRILAANVANEIGTGVIPRSKSPDKAFRERLRKLWDWWAPTADADGVLNIYGLQWLCAMARRESGEVFIRIRQRRAERSVVPLQFQVLESDFCPADWTQKAPNGNEIISGIEFSSRGSRIAYWMYRTHPAEMIGSNTGELLRIPADQIIHHYIPMRPGQLRGEPSTVQSLAKSYQYDKYDDAELMRKESRADYTGVIRRQEFSDDDYKYDPFTGAELEKDISDVPMLELEAGTFPNLLPGEDITLFDGDNTGSGYADFQRQQLLAIAAGADCPYELATGDYAKINDRVWRAVMNQYRREITLIQDHFLIHQICRVVWETFVDTAVLSGAVDPPADYGENRLDHIDAEHRPQAWPHINPLQDIQAKALEKNEGLNSRQAIIAEDGWDAEDVDRQRAEDQERERQLGIQSNSNSTTGMTNEPDQSPDETV